MGVVGMDIDFDVFANLISSIRVYDNGYAFLLNNEGEIMYHPTLSMDNRLENLKYEIVDKSENANHIVKYKYGSNSKRAAMRRLTNGLHLYVTVLEEEVSRNWTRLIWLFAMMSGGILLLFAGLTVFFTNRFTAPLIRLTEAAKKIESGSFDVTLDYDGKDEVGILTTTFNHLTKHLKKYINDLNSKVYTDALTSVRNKLAFTVMTSNLQERISASVGKLPEFAVGIFDCNFLKKVNDIHGHEKGDIYLRLACQHICKIFQHSPVFRIGGDEFAVILQQQDFQDREALEQRFVTKSAENNAATENAWEKIYLAKGIAVYDPAIDHSVSDVIKRADELMYQNKSEMKSGRQD
jgi:diguanylate cyclase (GGDEF)-like protein